ncbi:MAG: hypothetical protein JRH20_11000, partial [Deltaproteobacteria bacterium]|nr:hypothetical protein [Deltaproteobacteria bacterium]
MRGDHPVIRRAGVLGGMSGSPIYIQGKLVGALAYGWRFSKEPIFGVTPIANMLALTKLPLRGPGQAGGLLVAQREGRRSLGARAATRQRLALGLSRVRRGLNPWPELGPRPLGPLRGQMLVRAAVPLSVAGMSSSGIKALKEAFAPFGLEPVQGGGGGGSTAQGPSRFTPGAAIGVCMAKGDISLTGTGTVTHVMGDKVLAFGHSMFNAGEIYLPVTTAKIHHSHANLARSFKMSSPVRTMGALMQDRQAAIMADAKRRVSLMPMTVTLHSNKKRAVYKVRIAKHRFLTPSLVGMMVTSALKEAMPDVAGASYRLTTRIKVKGHRLVTIYDDGYTAAGVRLGGLGFARGLGAVRLLVNNPLGPVDLERVDVDLAVDYGKRPVKLVALRAASNVVKPGQKLRVTARFRPYKGALFEKEYTVQVPSSASDGILLLEASGGNSTRLDLLVPETTKQLLDYLQRGYPGTSLVLSISTPTQGLSFGGRMIKDLPPSALDALRTGAAVSSQKIIKTKWRKVFRTQRVVSGKLKMRLRVRSEDLK